MVSKKILGVAIAAAFSSQAFAIIDASVTPVTGAYTVAKESITTAQVSDGTTVDAGLINLTQAGAAGVLNIKVKAGAGVASGGHGYVRINLTNAKFAGAVPALTTSGAAFTAQSITQGGTANSAYVIIDLTAPAAGILQGDVFTLPLTALAVSASAPVSFTYTLYDTPSAAVNQTPANVLATTSASSVISVANALKQTFTANNLVADVNASPVFTKFTGNTATGTIGSFQFDFLANSTDATGLPITALSQLINDADGQSAVVLTGDVSFTAGANAAATLANVTFGGQGSTSSGKYNKFTTAGFTNAVAYPVNLTATGTINTGSYTLGTSLVGIATAAFGPTNAVAPVGVISYNGTTIQVPYLSTNPTVNQKLILVNRGSTAVPYSVSFTKEAGVTATAGAAATGTLAAKETKVIKASDIVTLTGGARTAATIIVTAPDTTIDAATQTVITDTTSVSYGSVDTVVLKN